MGPCFRRDDCPGALVTNERCARALITRALNRARGSLVEQPETLLRFRRHVADMQHAAHVGGPRLFRERLHGDEVPELPLVHLDLGHRVLEHPVLQQREAGGVLTGEHIFGYRFSHRRIPWRKKANAARPPKTDIADTLGGHWFTNRAGDALAMRISESERCPKLVRYSVRSGQSKAGGAKPSRASPHLDGSGADPVGPPLPAPAPTGSLEPSLFSAIQHLRSPSASRVHQ